MTSGVRSLKREGSPDHRPGSPRALVLLEEGKLLDCTFIQIKQADVLRIWALVGLRDRFGCKGDFPELDVSVRCRTGAFWPL